MEKLVLTVKDKSKLNFLIDLIKKFDFVEIQKTTTRRKRKDKYDFFASAGLWKDRSIDANELRKKAWTRVN